MSVIGHHDGDTQQFCNGKGTKHLQYKIVTVSHAYPINNKDLFASKANLTIIPGDDACIMSGLNRATSEIILGLSARERGTFWYQGKGKL